jgi:GNAT superfamily N-acetyltransferase
MPGKENNPFRRIRPYLETEKAEVVGVWHRSGLAAYPYLPIWQDFTIETATWVFENIIQPHNDIWVGTHDERIVAYMAINRSFIDRLYVDPLEWRKGWGTDFIKLAKQLSPAGLECFTHQENVAARALYEQNGFVAVKFGISPPPESAPDVEYHWRPLEGPEMSI